MALSHTELELLLDLIDQANESGQITFWFGPDTRELQNLDLVEDIPGGPAYIDLEIA